ncbi:(3S 6E)-nerolidol synthase 1 chloroplastic [Euphorbia peplus]|nr:(3S 6E)-nerolidol synthase 1 chloroplastic [Euphorbia peplus]
MTSSHKAFNIITCKISPSHSIATKQITHLDFKSNISPQKWTITPSNHLNFDPPNQQIITIDQVDFCKRLRGFKHMMLSQKDSVEESLAMIDAIQRLGIDYHFQDEIDEILKRQYEYYHTIDCCCDGINLHEITLQFRLLRQEGYYLPASDLLDSFTNKYRGFKQNLNEDIEGLKGLYEASQLSVGEEEDYLLDEAGDYSYNALISWLKHFKKNPQARMVKNTVAHPHHKSLPRFMAQNLSRSFDEQSNGLWTKELQDIAKFDLKIVQTQYKQEILQISRWWEEIGVSKELKFARNEPIKWHLWAMAILSDPNLCEQRSDLTKAISFIYLIDDIFDVHGSLDQLILFTQIIDRWDIASEQLPDYMRICFKALDKITNEISYKIYKQNGCNPVDSLRKTWGTLCKAFLIEARWFSSGQTPNAKEYLQNGIVSSGVHVVLHHIFFMLGHGSTTQGVEFINNNPAIVSSAATILRLWDDLGSAKDENQDGYDGSYLECYMKENKGCSEENARKKVIQMISDSWKKLNQECLFPTSTALLYSSTYRKCCLNLARMVALMYSYDDNQDLPLLQQHVEYLLGNQNDSIS